MKSIERLSFVTVDDPLRQTFQSIYEQATEVIHHVGNVDAYVYSLEQLTDLIKQHEEASDDIKKQ